MGIEELEGLVEEVLQSVEKCDFLSCELSEVLKEQSEPLTKYILASAGEKGIKNLEIVYCHETRVMDLTVSRTPI